MRSVPVRLAVTLLLPLLLVVACELVLLPGMADFYESLVRRGVPGFGLSKANASVFALGITPVIEAYGVVELAAFLVPKWSRLRHGNPEGRVKLERAARILAMALAAFQAWSVAKAFAAVENSSTIFATGVELASTPVVVATLVGGVCVHIVVAEIISRQGIANGYVLLSVVSAIAALRGTFGEELRKRLYLGTVDTRQLLLLVLVLALPAVATWLALRRAGDVQRATSGEEQGTSPYRVAPALSPYRAARALAISPWVPVPASSLAPYPIAIALMGLPLSVSYFLHLGPVSELAQSLLVESVPFTVVSAVLTAGLAVGLAKLLHRPRELAQVAKRVGFAGGDELASEARAAVKATLAPTLLFFAVLIGATTASRALPAGPSVVFVPLLVALVMDMAASMRSAGLVAVWQERRASAVPIVRAVLAAEGIEATARGMNVLSLLQVFAPYAPAEIMVAEADAERATELLRHVFLGKKRSSERRPDAGDSVIPDRGPPPWALARRVAALAGVAALSLGVVAAANLRPSPAAGANDQPRGRLEVVGVDDDLDVFGKHADTDLPPGIEIRFENAPVGRGRYTKVHFATTPMREGESYEAAFQRMRTWADGLVLPEGKRIGLQPVDDFDDDTGKSQRTGVRTFVLTGSPVITTDDVIDAVPSVNDTSGTSEVYVAITLSPDGGERFRSATRDFVQRRMAIVVNGQIESAPVVKSEITGGRLSITMGQGDPGRQLAEAKALASSLGGAHRP